MIDGEVVSINIAAEAGGPIRPVTEVRAVAGKGLEGDRYFAAAGTWSKAAGTGREVTFIEEEAIEALRREYGAVMLPSDARRNVVTRGVALNHLVGREFEVGEVRLQGIRLCEPCAHMERLAGVPRARQGLVHRGGLRAEIVRSGVLRVGDRIGPVADAQGPAVAAG